MGIADYAGCLKLQLLHLNQAPVPITVMPDFVGITQRIDDHAAALNIGIHRRVRMPGKPVGKAGQIHIVDEIGIERQFGKLWGGAGCIRRKVGQDDGVRRAAKLPYLCPFFVVQADVVFFISNLPTLEQTYTMSCKT